MRKEKRLTALLLALVMCLSVLPANVLATELGSEAETAEVAAPEGTGEAAEVEEPQAAETEEPDEESVEDVSPSTMAATSGKCGKNVTWKLDRKGTLTISGSGKMTDCDFEGAPWYANREKIVSVIIKSGVTSIGKYAFVSCDRMESVKIPNSVIAIGEAAFDFCDKLVDVKIPDSVLYIGRSAFQFCEGLKSIKLSNNITEISNYMFAFCDNLQSIKIPDKVTTIGESAFTCCKNMKKAVFSPNITSFGRGAFDDCESLEKVELPGKVENIGDWAFAYCSSLKNVKIPDRVVNIGESAFAYCNGMTEIYFYGNAPTISDTESYSAFTSVTATAYYPENDPTWTSDKRKDYGGNIMWKTWDPLAFSAEKDGWCIPNIEEGFGYEKKLNKNGKYRIPISRYFDTFGITILAPMKTIAKWTGSCFGLAILAAANYNGTVDLSSYTGHGGNGLAEYGYSSIGTRKDGTKYFTLANSELVNVVERAHISQISNQFNAVEVFKNDSDYTDLISYVSKNKRNPILVTLEGGLGGHTVLIDPSKEIYDCSGTKGEGWYAFYLYDPNVCQNGSALENPAEWYGHTSYLYVNKNTGKWEYYRVNKQEEQESFMENDYQFLWHRTIKFYDISRLGSEYFTGKLKTNAVRELWFSAKTIDVKSENSSVARFSDNKTEYLADGYDYNVYFEGLGTNTLKRYMTSIGNDISYTSPSADVLYGNSDSTYAISTDGLSTVNVSLPSQKVVIDAEKQTQVETVVCTEKKTDEVVLAFDVSPDTTISVEKTDDKVIVNSTSEIVVDITHTNKDGKKEEVEVIADGSKTIKLDDFAAEKRKNTIKASNVVKTTSKKARSFKLNAKTYGGAKLTYKSNNKSVKVDKNGKVTVAKKFVGTATITITAAATKNYNAASKKVTVTVNPTGTSLTSVKNSAKKTMKAAWKKNTAVTGYQVQYATASNFKGAKTVTIKKTKTTSTTIKKLKKNKKYYVRVRTYQKASGKNYYSNWSKTKTVTIKK